MGFLTQLSLSQAARQQLDAPTGEDRSIGGFFGNLVGDVGEIATGLGGLVKTVAGDAVDLVTPLGDNDYATDDILQALPGAIAGDYSARYGGQGLDEVGEQLYENPLSYIMDVVDVATLGATAGRKLVGSADEAAAAAKAVDGLGSADEIAEADAALMEIDDMGLPDVPFDAGPGFAETQSPFDYDLRDPEEAQAAINAEHTMFDLSPRQMEVLAGRMNPEDQMGLQVVDNFRQELGINDPLKVTDPFYNEYVAPDEITLPSGPSVTRDEWAQLSPEEQEVMIRSFDSDQFVPPGQIDPVSAEQMEMLGQGLQGTPDYIPEEFYDVGDFSDPPGTVEEFYDEWDDAPPYDENESPVEYEEELIDPPHESYGPFSMESSLPFVAQTGMDGFVPFEGHQMFPPVEDAGMATLTPDQFQWLYQYLRDLGYEV